MNEKAKEYQRKSHLALKKAEENGDESLNFSLVLCKAWIEAQTQLRVKLLGLEVFVTRFEQASLSFTRNWSVSLVIIEALIVDIRPKLAKVREARAI